MFVSAVRPTHRTWSTGPLQYFSWDDTPAANHQPPTTRNQGT